MPRVASLRVALPLIRLMAAFGVLGTATSCSPFASNLIPSPVAPSPNSEELQSIPAALYVSTEGSDGNSGTDSSQPLHSIETAIQRSGPGTTIHVEAGTYYEQLVTKRGGLPGAEITLQSEHGTAIVDGSELPWKVAGNQNQGLVELRNPYVRFLGFKVAHSKNSGIVLGSDHLIVQGCEVSDVQRHGITTDTRFQTAVGQAMIQDVTITGNQLHATTLAGSGTGQAISLIADGFVISKNRVYDNQDIGIDVWLGSRHGEVVGNTVYHNVNAAGIYVDGAAYVRIERNRVYANKNGILVSSEDPRYQTHHIWVYDNLVYDHEQNCGCGIWDPDVGAQQVLFAHNTLYRNLRSFVLEGSGNSAEIVDNLGFAIADDYLDHSQQSAFENHDNTWLVVPNGFVAPDQGDFHLTANSPGIAQGQPLPPLVDDLGNAFPIDTDFDLMPWDPNGRIDAGAFQSGS